MIKNLIKREMAKKFGGKWQFLAVAALPPQFLTISLLKQLEVAKLLF